MQTSVVAVQAPAQHGCPVPPHGVHVPLAHTFPLPQVLPPQQGWLRRRTPRTSRSRIRSSCWCKRCQHSTAAHPAARHALRRRRRTDAPIRNSSRSTPVRPRRTPHKSCRAAGKADCCSPFHRSTAAHSTARRALMVRRRAGELRRARRAAQHASALPPHVPHGAVHAGVARDAAGVPRATGCPLPPQLAHFPAAHTVPAAVQVFPAQQDLRSSRRRTPCMVFRSQSRRVPHAAPQHCCPGPPHAVHIPPAQVNPCRTRRPRSRPDSPRPHATHSRCSRTSCPTRTSIPEQHELTLPTAIPHVPADEQVTPPAQMLQARAAELTHGAAVHAGPRRAYRAVIAGVSGTAGAPLRSAGHGVGPSAGVPPVGARVSPDARRACHPLAGAPSATRLGSPILRLIRPPVEQAPSSTVARTR